MPTQTWAWHPVCVVYASVKKALQTRRLRSIGHLPLREGGTDRIRLVEDVAERFPDQIELHLDAIALGGAGGQL